MCSDRLKFSICIPAYNSAERIAGTIDSVLEQKSTDYEIVIVDDNSDDGTAEIIEDYRKKYGRVRAYFNENNKGLFANHNICVAKSHGKWVGFVHSDDELKENAFEIWEDCIDKYPDLDGIIPRTHRIPEGFNNESIKLNGIDDAPKVLRWRGALVSGAVYKRSKVRQVQFTQKTMAGDWELPMRILTKGGRIIINLKETTNRYLGGERTSQKVKRNEGWVKHNAVALEIHMDNKAFRSALLEDIPNWSAKKIYGLLNILDENENNDFVFKIQEELREQSPGYFLKDSYLLTRSYRLFGGKFAALVLKFLRKWSKLRNK